MIHSPPTVILVRPQLGENIGLTLRAAANFGVKDVRLVAPRDGWPSPAADQASSGASHHTTITLYDTLPGALSSLTHTIAVTARHRDMKKTWIPFEARALNTALSGKGGLVFGPEKTGLTNEDISHCHGALSLPTNPDFPSLNLSHAVAVCLSVLGIAPQPKRAPLVPAPLAQSQHLLTTLEDLLTVGGFFHPPEKAEKMRHNLRDLIHRTPLSTDDINTWLGVVHTLAGLGDKSKKKI